MTQPEPVNPGAQPVAKTFTQDEVNAFLAEDRRKIQTRYGDYDDLKAKAAQYDEIAAQNATELEKAVKAADAAARADVSGKANERLVRAEIRAVAAGLGFNDPVDAAIQLQARLSEIKVSDDGDVDSDAAKTLVEELAKSKPYLVKTGLGRPQPLPGQGHHQPPVNDGKARAQEQLKKRFPEKFADKA